MAAGIDTLLEQQINQNGAIQRLSERRWRDIYTPGVEQIPHSAFYRPSSFRLEPGRLPYFKLHGSSNWREGDSAILIMGGNKGPDIQKSPFLRSYHDHFISVLSEDAGLMVIGYGFQDLHINQIILDAVKTGMKLFIVDRLGVDVLDKAPRLDGDTRTLKERVYQSILGGSRRDLITTFSSDHVERAKLLRFFST
jgi:hypothetical protein